jgi:RNA polymerase sigma-70 factor (ECF subfamily)
VTRDRSSGDTSILEPNAQNELLIAVAAGDKTAFSSLFHHFAPRVKALLIRAGAQAEVADEIVQDVMLTVWRKAGEYDPARASAAAWIFTIARNRRIDLLRHERRPEIDPNDPELRPADPEDAETALERAQLGARLRDAIGSLPREQEEALAATFFNDRSYGDYAAQSGLPLGTVKSRLRLAMARLRLELKEAH